MNFGDMLIIIGIVWCCIVVFFFGYAMILNYVRGDDTEDDFGLCYRGFSDACIRLDNIKCLEIYINNTDAKNLRCNEVPFP